MALWVPFVEYFVFLLSCGDGLVFFFFVCEWRGVSHVQLVAFSCFIVKLNWT